MMQGKAEANHLNGFLIYELKYFFCEVTSVKCVHIAFYYLTQNICKIAQDFGHRIFTKIIGCFIIFNTKLHTKVSIPNNFIKVGKYLLFKSL